MYSLIISIISIALISSLTLTGAYYSGSTIMSNTLNSDINHIVNQGNQIASAISISRIDRNKNVNDINDLVTEGYLEMVPTFYTLSWLTPGTSSTNLITGKTGYSFLSDSVSIDLCNKISEKAEQIKYGTGQYDVRTLEGSLGCITATNEVFYKTGSFY